MALSIPLPAPLKRRVAKFLLERTMRNGIDLRKLRFLPESFTLPIKRDGLDPLPALMQAQARRAGEAAGEHVRARDLAGHRVRRGPRRPGR